MTHRLVLFCISTKYHKNIQKGLWLTEPTRNQLSLWNITKGVNTKSKRQSCHSCDTSHPIYIYHQNIPKGIQVTEQARNLFQIKQRVITPKERKPELSILYVTRISSWSTFLSSITKKFQGFPSFRADKKFYADADADANEIHPKYAPHHPPPPPHLQPPPAW